MARLGIVKSDETSYSYVFVNGQCYMTVFVSEPGSIATIVASPITK